MAFWRGDLLMTAFVSFQTMFAPLLILVSGALL